MAKLKELFERAFDVWCMKNWLRHIDKEIMLCNKYETKASHYKNEAYHHKQVAQKLYDEYCKKYGKAGDNNERT